MSAEPAAPSPDGRRINVREVVENGERKMLVEDAPTPPSEKGRERLGDDDERSKRVSKWVPTTDLMMLRRMGKTSEECAELMCVLARCIIQGIDEVDPSSGKVNRQRLIEELADVQAQINCTVGWLNLDSAYIAKRCETKEGYMRKWEGLFGDTPALRQADAPVGWKLVPQKITRPAHQQVGAATEDRGLLPLLEMFSDSHVLLHGAAGEDALNVGEVIALVKALTAAREALEAANATIARLEQAGIEANAAYNSACCRADAADQHVRILQEQLYGKPVIKSEWEQLTERAATAEAALAKALGA